MSTKSHFLLENGIEGFEQKMEPQSIFGTFVGFNVYLFIDNDNLTSFKIKDEYLFIEMEEDNVLPKKFKLWGGAILDFEWDLDGILIHLKGGHHITKAVIANDYTKIKII